MECTEFNVAAAAGQTAIAGADGAQMYPNAFDVADTFPSPFSPHSSPVSLSPSLLLTLQLTPP